VEIQTVILISLLIRKAMAAKPTRIETVIKQEMGPILDSFGAQGVINAILTPFNATLTRMNAILTRMNAI